MKTHEFNDLLNKISTNVYTQTTLRISTDLFYEEAEEYRLKDEQGLLLTTAIKKNHYIVEVDLSGNNLTDVSAIALASIKSLKILNLAYNNITAKGVISLATSTITKLYLQGNDIVIDDVALIDALIQNKTITELNLHSSWCLDEMIAKLIRCNTTIQILSLGDGLTDKALEFIGQNQSLKKLAINTSDITDKGIQYLANNNSIKALLFGDSNIGDIGAKILSKHFSLQELRLRNSDITKVGSEYFLDGNLKKVVISSGAKHGSISFNEIKDFEYKFAAYQFKKLKDQQEYYYNITGGKQYFDINPDMNDFNSIQNTIDFLQEQWSKEYFEQNLMGDINNY